jgi:hypothetical protein
LSDEPNVGRRPSTVDGTSRVVRVPGVSPVIKLLYITSSSYSGSTLLAFLLNTHPEVFTVGEMDGWNYAPDREFHCSCGATIRTCPLFQSIAKAFREIDLPFDPRNFGTEYRLTKNRRLNRWLLAKPPLPLSSRAERIRDRVVGRAPLLAARLARHDLANLTFIRTALAYGEASVFVDACKNPYRLRHLRRLYDLDVHVVHLIRDPRGIALSNRTKRGWDLVLTTRLWVQEQARIVQIASEFDARARLYYEDLCSRPDEVVRRIYGLLGLRAFPLPQDFKAVEHHILGNVMRLQDSGRISPDVRWRSELSESDQRQIQETALAVSRTRRGAAARDIVEHYLASG